MKRHSTSPTFALVAGEVSGDQLGAALITDLRSRFPTARFVGIGGENMRSAGMETWWDSEELALFGLFEVLAHFPRLYKIRRKLVQRILSVQPDVFIGIDAPDFNLGVEIKLKAAGIKTVHYVSPTVWAWRPKRVRKIARAADLVLCLFPFEPDFFHGHGVAAEYVGHPLAEQIPLQNDTVEARSSLGVTASGQVLALLPGSRASEVSRLARPMVVAAALLSKQLPDLKFIAAMANPAVEAIFRSALDSHPGLEVRIVPGQARRVIAAADTVVCASGTVTLETMLINRPMVSVYRLAPATYHLARTFKLIERQFFALPNILAGEALIPELIQDEASPERMAECALRWLTQESDRQALYRRFEALHNDLRCNASERAATAVSGLLEREK